MRIGGRGFYLTYMPPLHLGFPDQVGTNSRHGPWLYVVSLSQPGLNKTKLSVLCHKLQSDLGPAASKANLSMNKHLPANFWL